MTLGLLTEQRGDIGIVRAWGEVDIAVSPLLVEALVRMIGTSRCVELDLRGVTFFDCSGLHALRHAERTASERGCRIVVRRSSAVVRTVRLVEQVSRGRRRGSGRVAA